MSLVKNRNSVAPENVDPMGSAHDKEIGTVIPTTASLHHKLGTAISIYRCPDEVASSMVSIVKWQLSWNPAPARDTTYSRIAGRDSRKI